MIRQTIIFFLILEFAVGLAQNPCNDERYLQIKNKSLDDMSDRQYSYFLQKEKECNEYTMAQISKGSIDISEPAPPEALNKSQKLNVLLGIDPDTKLDEDVFNIFVKKLDSLNVDISGFEDGYEWSGGYYGVKTYIDENIDELLNIFAGKKKLVLTDSKANGDDDEVDDDTEGKPRKDNAIEISEDEPIAEPKGKKTGFRIGGTLIRPVITGAFFTEYSPFFDIGIVINTPIGIKLGPVFASIGLELNKYSFANPSVDSLSYFGKYIAGVIDIDISQVIRFGGENNENHIFGGLADYDDGIGLVGGANQVIRLFKKLPISLSVIERINLVKLDSGSITYWFSLGGNIGIHF